MIHTKVVIGALMLLALALPALGKTYKFSYTVPCSQVWDAVKNTLSNQENYAGVKSDDAHLTADYSPKHSVHFDVSGVILQRTNHVTLIAVAEGCDMNVVSNYSGWGHEDQGDFKKRVDEALAKPKSATPAEPATPAKPAKPAEPAKPAAPTK
jgi:hypothetical protein